MGVVLRRFLLLFIGAVAVTYIVFLAAGSATYAREETERTVWLRDQLGPNMHRIAGAVTVPGTCFELHVETEKVTQVLYKLKFTTWESPIVPCVRVPTTRPFYEVIFAPAVGVHFIATLDDEPLPIVVVPYIP